MDKRIMKLIILVILTSMILSLMPGMALAAQNNNVQMLSKLVDNDGYLTNEGLESLGELPSDPKEYVDNKDNNNGTKSVLLYLNPIKYKDNNGNYQYIDNSLVQSGDKNYKYKNKASDINVQLSDNLNQDSAINLNYLGYSIGFKPLNIQTNNGKSSAGIGLINANDSRLEDKIFDKTKKYESIDYSRTFDNNTNIEITPVSDGLKENIVLNSIPKNNRFSYEIKVSGAVPVLRRDGNLYFVDLNKNVIVGVIAAPIMHDSSVGWEYSEDIAVQLRQKSENTYVYTLTPDKSYLAKAVYPVVIDPSLNTRQNGTGDVGDTYVKSGSSGNYCVGTDIIVGRNSSGDKYRGFIKIMPDGITYLNNSLGASTITNVYYHAYQSYSGSSAPSVELHPVTQSWALNTVTYSNEPSYDGAYSSQTVNSTGWYTWDVTAMGKDWFYNTTGNYGTATYGIMLKIANESLNQYKTFNSAQNGSNQDYFEFDYV